MFRYLRNIKLLFQKYLSKLLNKKEKLKKAFMDTALLLDPLLPLEF